MYTANLTVETKATGNSVDLEMDCTTAPFNATLLYILEISLSSDVTYNSSTNISTMTCPQKVKFSGLKPNTDYNISIDLFLLQMTSPSMKCEVQSFFTKPEYGHDLLIGKQFTYQYMQ